MKVLEALVKLKGMTDHSYDLTDIKISFSFISFFNSYL